MISAPVHKAPDLEQERRELEALARYTPNQRAEALSLFLGANMEPAAIALQLGLPAAVIAWFSEKDKWVEKRMAIEDKLMEETASVERRLILEQRPQIRRRHLENAEKLEEIALEMAQGGDISAHQLKSAIDAYGVAAGIAARAVGMDDGSGRQAAPASNVKVTVSPVIMVGAGPRAPVSDMRQAREITINVDDANTPAKMGAGEPRAPAGVPAGTPQAAPDPAAPGDREDPGPAGVQTVPVDG